MLAGSTLSTAVLALILGGAGLLFSIVNFVVAARNRRQDEEDKKDQRAAEQSYKYSKEVQVLDHQLKYASGRARPLPSVFCLAAVHGYKQHSVNYHALLFGVEFVAKKIVLFMCSVPICSIY